MVDFLTATASGMAPPAGVCLQTEATPLNLGPHIPCAGQLPGHCVQGEQSHVAATVKGQQ